MAKRDHVIRIVVFAPSHYWEKLFSDALDAYLSDGILNDAGYEYELDVIYREDYIDFSDIDFPSLDADVIIARGLAMRRLTELTDVPIMQVPLTFGDLTNTLEAAKRLYDPKRIIAIGYNFSAFGIDRPTVISGVELTVKNLTDKYFQGNPELIRKNISEVIEQARREGYDAFILGKYGHNYAISKGYNSVFNEICSIDAWHAIENAIQIASIFHGVWNERTRYKRIVDYSFEGIISFDENMNLLLCNDSAKTLLFGRNSVHGDLEKAVRQTLDKLGLRTFIDRHVIYTDYPLLGPNGGFVASIIPNIDQERYIGCTILLQDANRFQDIGSRTKKKFLERGLIARHTFDDICGTSEALTKTKAVAKKYSGNHLNVIIVGESGTGKEFFAQSIHNASPRAKGPFVAINCAALSDSLLESELFGYVGGAFTGAIKSGKAGYFEMANEGTIFLDEISEISPRVQGKLLRAIQEREIVRLGDDKITSVNVRIICATNRDLRKLVDAGEFREDLYYRLDVLRIDLPNLSERSEDIPLLAKTFFDEFILNNGMDVTVRPEAYERLKTVHWSGNIRQLRNVCMRAAILAENGTVSADTIWEAVRCDTSVPAPLSEEAASPAPPAVEPPDDISRALAKAGGNKSEAARLLGISRATLYRRMSEASRSVPD